MEPKKVAECRVSGILFIPIIDCPSGYCCVFNSCTDAMNGSLGVYSATKMFQVCNSSFILIITDHNLQLRLHPSPSSPPNSSSSKSSSSSSGSSTSSSSSSTSSSLSPSSLLSPPASLPTFSQSALSKSLIISVDLREKA